ncbi:MAG: alkane 1-monooxygenase [Bacteroidota bacterium]
MRVLRYLLVFTLPVTVYISFYSTGVLTFLPILYAFVLIPFLELFVKPDKGNKASEAIETKENRLYDWLLYLVVPIQFGFLALFLTRVTEPGLAMMDLAGRISAMGLLCGVLGINVAHELGHRNNRTEQLLAKSLLMTSLYMHFFIEHNRGHHKHVSTIEDPNSARKGEILYAFWIRSVLFAYLSAWKISFGDMAKQGRSKFSFHNEMLQYQMIQLLLIAVIFAVFGGLVLGCFICAAIFGFLLLETVNYIEHYGLSRKKDDRGRYERVRPAHSWNSDHLLGRMLLFELSRHSDHHFLANRKYQTLRHMDNSPQMPTGYPGMMLLSFLPPVWFFIIHRSMKNQALLQ